MGIHTEYDNEEGVYLRRENENLRKENANLKVGSEGMSNFATALQEQYLRVLSQRDDLQAALNKLPRFIQRWLLRG